jgi:hypothetical protein
MRWAHRPGYFNRIRLRRAALRYAYAGWDVTPGACFVGSRFTCDRLGCPTVQCHPALEGWEDRASHDPVQVTEWWRAVAHTVLLPTGRAFDVLEVPGWVGLHALAAARALRDLEGPGRGPVRGPVAVTPTGRWMFLVRPGDPLRPELDGQADVVCHGQGSWVPAPPTRFAQGSVRWLVAPEEGHWRLPDSYGVQRLLVDARVDGLFHRNPAQVGASAGPGHRDRSGVATI